MHKVYGLLAQFVTDSFGEYQYSRAVVEGCLEKCNFGAPAAKCLLFYGWPTQPVSALMRKLF